MIDRARLRSGIVPELAGAVVLTAFFLVASGHNAPPQGGHPVGVLGYGLLVAAGLAVALCRRWPRAALVVVVIVLGCYLGRRYPEGPIYLAGMIALFSLAWHTDRRTAFIGAGILVVTLTVVAATTRGAGFTVLPAVFAGWASASVLLGDALRNRRAYLEGVRERARSVELTRDEQSRRRIAEDRLRIARDLHDSVGHAMAMINVQAGAGAHVADQRPEAAKKALVAIQHASGDVLDELTAMLSALRDDSESADRIPTPGVPQIRELVETSGSQHLHTTMSIDGETDELPGAIGVAAYRIVQESLTNVIRHAKATHVSVRVQGSADRGLVVEVADDGTGPSSSVGSGVGIRGMRERAESSGGALETGPGPLGGFLVRASWGLPR
jgi:signal transduction histidine kinase